MYITDESSMSLNNTLSVVLVLHDYEKGVSCMLLYLDKRHSSKRPALNPAAIDLAHTAVVCPTYLQTL